MENEALEPLDKKNNHRFDISHNFYIMLTWSISAIIILIPLESIAKESILYAILFVIVMIAISYMIEFFITAKYDDSQYTSYKQTMIRYIDFPIVIFIVIIVLIFNKHNAYYYIYPVVLCLVSFSMLITGFILDELSFQHYSIFNLIISLFMFGGFLYFGEDAFNYTEKYIALVSYSMSFAYMTIVMKYFKRKL